MAGVFSGGGFDRLLGADAELDPSLRALVGTLRAKGDGGTDIGVGGAGDRASLRGGGGDVEGVGDIDGWGPGREPGWGEHDGFGDKPSGEMVGIASEPVIVGTLTAREVDEVVKRHLRRVRHCYQRELQREPALAGKLTVRFTIASDGSVSRARIQDDTLGNDAVDRCVVSRFYSMTFPKPRGSSKGVVLVNYPFVFAPG